jgi:Ca2+-binding RTX toxin-like protein
MATTLNFLEGAISKTEGFHWERLILSALNSGTLTEEVGPASTLTLTAPDGAKLILSGTFMVLSEVAATGEIDGFEVLKGSTPVMTAEFDHQVLIEEVLSDSEEDATLEDLIEALQVMFAGLPVTANGSAAHEMVFGGGGADVLSGNSGDERFTGFQGNDHFDGGAGWDDVRYNVEQGTQNIIVNLSGSNKTVLAETVAGLSVRDSYGFTDTLAGINFVSGTAQGDFFFGRDGAGEFGDYPDFVSGAAGGDTFTGGSAALGVAYDQADIESGGGKVKVNLSTTTKYGLNAGTARDTFGDIDTLVNIKNVALSQKDDTVFGGNASEHFWGRDGDDLMQGNRGRDHLEGDGGKDTIEGGDGKDTLSGGLDRDRLTGGQDADQFVYFDVVESKSGSTKRDYITDFKHGTDKIHVGAIDANTTKFDDQSFKLDARGSKNSDVEKGHIGWYFINKSGSANDRTILKFNVDNDSTIEMEIELKGLIDLSKGDFIL